MKKLKMLSFFTKKHFWSCWVNTKLADQIFFWSASFKFNLARHFDKTKKIQNLEMGNFRVDKREVKLNFIKFTTN